MKHFLSIIMVFVLLLSVVGVSYTKSLCAGSSEGVSQNCCSKGNNNEESCCLEVTEIHKIKAELATVNASIEVVDILLLPYTFLISFFEDNAALLDAKQSELSYLSPPIIEDIPVLISCFRI